MKTIKQIAGEIGVSKQAVFKKIKRQPLAATVNQFTSTVDGVIYINDEGINLIKQAFKAVNEHPADRQPTINQPSTVGDNQPSTVDALLSIVKEQQQTIKELTAANRELTAAIENTTASLHAAQALHAGTMKKHLTDGNTEPTGETPPIKKRVFFDLFKKRG
jgi:predicted phage tail protein